MTSASTFSDKSNGRTTPRQPETDPSDVLVNAAEAISLPPRPEPVAPERYFLHGREPGSGEVIVLHTAASLEEIIAHSASNLRAEVGGVLLGRAYQEQQRLIVEVQAALPAISNDHGPVHFTFTADAWSQIHRDRSAKCPQLDIVGWFHTHPGLGVFYSSDDVVVHSAAFTMPWHVGLVVDPLRNEAAYFGWVNQELTPMGGFYEIQQESEKPVAPWRMVRTSIWHERETEAFYATFEEQGERPSEPFSPAELWSSPQENPAFLGILLGAAGLLLSFILLVFFVLPLRGEVNQLQGTVITLANETNALNSALCPDDALRIYTPVAETGFAVGTGIPIVGTAAMAEAARFRLEMRTEGSAWTLISVVRRPEKLGTLATWETGELAPGEYELRLSAVDRNNIRINTAPVCTIPIQLTP